MSPHTANIEQVSEALLQGKLIAYPTEAVWGLGCDPFNEQAVKRLLHLKNRPVSKGLILLVSSFEQIQPYLADDISDESLALLISVSDAPVTWLVPFNQALIPKWITGEHSKLAVRLCNHPVVTELCQTFGKPITSTSANPAGSAPALSSTEVKSYFGDSLHICEGETGHSIQPSQIKDLLTGVVVRD